MPSQQGSGVRAARVLMVSAAILFSMTVLASLSGADDKPPTVKDTAKDTPAKDAPAKDAPASPAPPVLTGTLNDDAVVAFINEQIDKGWKDNKLNPSPKASDYEYMRRVFLDMIGRIPNNYADPSAQDPIAKLGEIQYFLGRPEKTRRAEIVDYLIQHEDFARNWANLWTVWLLTRTAQPGIDRESTRRWLEDAFAINKPYDKMVEDILTSTGKSDENGAVNFLLTHVGERLPQDKQGKYGEYEMIPATSRMTKLFLGVQTQCTQCHDHPFIDVRKQHQFWGMNVFLRQIEREGEPGRRNQQNQARFMTLADNLGSNAEGSVFYERRNGLLLRAQPTYLDGTRIDPKLNRRQALSKLLLKDDYFAKALVNRFWGHFMGRGFTNPVDDFGEHNPVSHPELLDYLGKAFAASGYDQRRLMKWIASSAPYALSNVASKDDPKTATTRNDTQDAEPYFSRVLLRAMTPEQLVDSVFTATNAENTKSSREDRRKMYEDWLRDFSVNFGDDEGNEATFNGTVVQALLLMNGDKLNVAIKANSGSTLHRAMQVPVRGNAGWKNRLDYIYLSTLCRKPTEAEYRTAFRVLGPLPVNPQNNPDPAGPWEDVIWALLNSNEFILNH